MEKLIRQNVVNEVIEYLEERYQFEKRYLPKMSFEESVNQNVKMALEGKIPIRANFYPAGFPEPIYPHYQDLLQMRERVESVRRAIDKLKDGDTSPAVTLLSRIATSLEVTDSMITGMGNHFGNHFIGIGEDGEPCLKKVEQGAGNLFKREIKLLRNWIQLLINSTKTD